MDYIIYFAITIGIIVVVHEFGHFAAAKLSGMRAEVFAIGYGRRLLGWNKITGFTWGPLPKDFEGGNNTDYRICLLPLGGYVKISGMVDESFDTDFAGKEPEPYEFRVKSTPKKLFVITAGVMMNLTLTLLIFWGINLFQGKQIIKTTEIGVIADDSKAAQAGFQSNDKILEINNVAAHNWDDVVNNLLVENIGNDVRVLVQRDSVQASFIISSEFLAEASQESFFLPYGHTKPFISDVMNDSPASDAGIEPGDVFLELNGSPLNQETEVITIVSSNPGVEMPLTILRGEDTLYTNVTPGMEGKIGVSLGGAYTGPIEYESYGIIESFTNSVSNISQYTVLTFSLISNVITGDIAFNQAFGGPVKIAKFAAKSADTGFLSFFYFIAMLSLSLGIINILPFPVLDGGHMVIIIIEGIMRRELPIKVKIAIQNAGFIVLLLLMAFIIYSDIISL